MGVELTMLTYSAILAFVLIMIPVGLRTMQYGLASGVGNREEPRPLSGWGGRADRAAANMLETFPIFIALVLVAHFSAANDSATAMGAQLYFFGRLAYAVIYILGITWVRTAAWLVSLAGMAMIASVLF